MSVPSPRPHVAARAAATDSRATSEAMLIRGAERWIREALEAWSEDDQAKVVLMAPMAVELLGKAALWRENPVLLVLLHERHEDTLLQLATKPDLSAKGVKTIGLQIVLSRLIKLLGDLPVPGERRGRMVDVRNGALHVGSGDQSRYILLDCLSIIGVLLQRLGVETSGFYGVHTGTVRTLLDERLTEISRRVAAKMAQARARLTRLEDALGDAAFEAAMDELEEQRATLDPDDFVGGGNSVESECPECGSKARLFGEVDARAESEYDVEPLGGGQYMPIEVPYWQPTFSPQAFSCMVCKLTLHGTEELAEAGLRWRTFDVDDGELRSDFDLDAHLRSRYMDD